MKKLFVAIMMMVLAGCGGGGDGGTKVPTPPINQQAAVVTPVDGLWKDNSGRLFENNSLGLAGYIDFSKGSIHTYGITGLLGTPGTYVAKDGTFSVSGNQVSYHLTTYTWGDTMNISQISTRKIDENWSATFSITDNQLTLTDGSRTLVFTKQ